LWTLVYGALTGFSCMTDAFAILGLEPSYSIQEGELKERHRALSLALHPDRFLGRPAGERREALGRAIEVNAAYRILKDPISRGELLLQRLGLGPSDEAGSSVSQDLLLEMMDLREELAKARAARESTTIVTLAARVRTTQEVVQRELVSLFTDALRGEVTNPALLRDKLGAMRYQRRFLDETHAALDELG
jgi:molecular chaperone HscB